MFAIVESGSITSMPRGNKGITLNGNKYPAQILHYGQKQKEMLLVSIQ